MNIFRLAAAAVALLCCTALSAQTNHEEAIREDPLFDLLVNEGALEAAVTAAHRRRLESDPLDGADAAGRKETAPRQKSSARKRTTGERTAPPEGGAETDA